MEAQENMNEMNEKIRRLKQTAQDLNRHADGFPALSRNTARILASIKMLELNISDVSDLQENQKKWNHELTRILGHRGRRELREISKIPTLREPTELDTDFTDLHG